ncbi:MAG TPA: hypothetical protein VIV12_18535, partial [Streptosporangiaceae bacterium]
PTADAVDLCEFRNSSGTEIVQVDTDLTGGNTRFNCRNVVTATDSTDTTTLSTGTWYRVELSVTIADSPNGSVECRFYTGDSTSPFGTQTISATDTLTTNIQRFGVGVSQSCSSNCGEVYVDDVAWNDTSGSFQTSWPGPGKIAMVKPGSNDTVTWTKTGANCSGTTNTDCVDDEPGLPDDLSGYNRTTTVQTDRFNITTITGPDADDDMILIHVMGRSGGASATGTNTAAYSVWTDGGAKTSGATTAICDINGWTAVNLNWAGAVVLDLGSAVKSAVQSYDVGITGVQFSQGCNTTSIWANVEWIDFTPPVCTAGLNLTMLGIGGCP